MFDLTHKKRDLKTLRDRVERLGVGLPQDALGPRRIYRALLADIDHDLGQWLRTPGSAECSALANRANDLERFCSAFAELCAQTTPVGREEDRVSADCWELEDEVFKDWLAERSRLRSRLIACLGLDAGELSDLIVAAEQLDHLRQIQAEDRRLLALLSEAQKRLRPAPDAPRARPLAEGLAALKVAILEHKAKLDGDWETRLESWLEPLRAFHQRDRPPSIDELGEVLRRMEDWLQVLGKGASDARHADMENRLWGINRRTWILVEHWQAHEDDKASRLLHDAQELELELIARAQELRDGLMRDLMRARAIFGQFADRERAPQLLATLARLTGETPENPRALLDWRNAAFDALDDLEAAIGGYRPQIEEKCAQLVQETEGALDGLSTRILDQPARSEALDLRRALADLTKEPFHTLLARDLAEAIGRLESLTKQASMLERRSAEDLRALEAELESIADRTRRLERLAGLLGLPVPDCTGELKQGSNVTAANLEALRGELERRCEVAAGVEREILEPCWTVLDADLSRLGQILALLDPDLAPEPLLPALLHIDLAEAEQVQAALPELCRKAEDALAAQVLRLRDRRTAVLAHPAAIDSRPGADGDALMQTISALRHWREPIPGNQLDLARSLTLLVTRAEQQLAKLDEAANDLAEQRSKLRARLTAIHDEVFELAAQQHMLDRIATLIADVPSVVVEHHQATDQIFLARSWLTLLERHAANCAGSGLQRDLETLDRTSPVAALELRAEIGSDLRHRPPRNLRERARSLARQRVEG